MRGGNSAPKRPALTASAEKWQTWVNNVIEFRKKQGKNPHLDSSETDFEEFKKQPKNIPSLRSVHPESVLNNWKKTIASLLGSKSGLPTTRRRMHY
jgi:hypothetical protein